MADDNEPQQPARVKYVVHAANIKDDDGEKYQHGEVVELGPKLARHYNQLGYLRPFIPPPSAADHEEKVRHVRRTIPSQRQSAGEGAPPPRTNRTTPL